ncbi:MAG TPA: protein rep [Roseomonas sp.]
MFSVPVDGARRLPFDRHLGHPVHSQQTGKTQIPSKWDLRRFLERYSCLRSIRLCGVASRPCDHWLCPRCSPKRQRAYRRTLQQALSGQAPKTVISWTSTVASRPGRPLGKVWTELESLTRHMTSGNWLNARVDGFVRMTEITHSEQGGWHPHHHWLLISRTEFTPEQVNALRSQVLERYLRRADLAGIHADEAGQIFQSVPVSDLGKLLGYITKQHTQRGDPTAADGRAPGDLLAAAYAGDVDAMDLWQELEQASFRRITRTVAGALRKKPKSRA